MAGTIHRSPGSGVATAETRGDAAGDTRTRGRRALRACHNVPDSRAGGGCGGSAHRGPTGGTPEVPNSGGSCSRRPGGPADRMLRLLHTADVHLGARHADLGEHAAAQLQRHLAAFFVFNDPATTEKVDVVLIAGDLFDS